LAEEVPPWLLDFVAQYGYAGVFLASVVGSLIPFVPLPYLFIVVLLSDTLDPLLLGIIAGLGGSLGKITSYFLGRSGYRFFRVSTKKRMDALRSLLGRYGDLGVFIFAVTPLPDDIYIIPIGMMRFDFWRFLLANTAGKVLLAIVVAYLGRAYFELVRFFVGGAATLPAIVAVIIFMVAITFLLLRVDWELTLQVVRKQGWRGVLSNLSAILSLGRNRR